MNFSEWLVFKEGKAPKPSEDMEKFAHEAWIMLMRLTPISATNQVIFSKPWISRSVTNIKGEARKVELHFKNGMVKKPDGTLVHINKAGDAGTLLNGDGIINLFIDFDEKGNSTWSKSFFDEVVLHELIHIFDPKLRKSELRNAKWGRDIRGVGDGYGDAYYNSPHELDAFMGSKANTIIKHYKDAFPYIGEFVPNFRHYLSKLKPNLNSEIEKRWWQDHLNKVAKRERWQAAGIHKRGQDSLWEKYVKTLHARFERDAERWEQKQKEDSPVARKKYNWKLKKDIAKKKGEERLAKEKEFKAGLEKGTALAAKRTFAEEPPMAHVEHMIATYTKQLNIFKKTINHISPKDVQTYTTMFQKELDEQHRLYRKSFLTGHKELIQKLASTVILLKNILTVLQSRQQVTV